MVRTKPLGTNGQIDGRTNEERLNTFFNDSAGMIENSLLDRRLGDQF